MKAKILFVEDDLNLQKSLTYILEKEQFSVTTTRNGEEAVQIALREDFDLMLLDLGLPGIDGFEVCRRLKLHPKVAGMFIIMLTGKNMVEEITRGLIQYADDYVTKPTEPPILLARIHAVLRRRERHPEPESAVLRFGELSIDLQARELTLGGNAVPLSRTEFDLLALLAGNPNCVFSRSRILDHIRRDEFDTTERIVDSQVSALRKKLAAAAPHIRTVHGVGYKFKI